LQNAGGVLRTRVEKKFQNSLRSRSKTPSRRMTRKNVAASPAKFARRGSGVSCATCLKQSKVPLILKAENYDQWLDEKAKNTERLQNFLIPFPAAELASYAVSKAVNNPSYDSPELIKNSE